MNIHTEKIRVRRVSDTLIAVYGIDLSHESETYALFSKREAESLLVELRDAITEVSGFANSLSQMIERISDANR